MVTTITYHTDGTKTVQTSELGKHFCDPVENYRPDKKSKEYKGYMSDFFGACREVKRREGRGWERTIEHSTTDLKRIFEL